MKTIKLQGKDYAQVADRVKQFREDCPNGIIETVPNFQEGGYLNFSCRIMKDKANQASGEATGNSYGKLTGEKSFEKLETIAVGRALALLGYMASGEIASGEEMQEFMEYKNQQEELMLIEATEKLEDSKTLDELKTSWSSIPAEAKLKLTELKDKIKAKLSEVK